MDNIKAKAELIWAKLSSIQSQALTPEEQKKIIENELISFALEMKNVGRKQVLTHLETEMKIWNEMIAANKTYV